MKGFMEAVNKQATIKSDRVQHMIRYLAGFITGVVGIADMLSSIVPRFTWSFFLGAWPIINHRIPAQTFTVVIGFFLILLSYGLARGKKHARNITLILLFLSAVLHIQRSGSVLATVVALAFAMTLLALSRFFKARSDPPSVRRGYIALCLGLGIVVFYAIGGFIALYDEFEPWVDRIGIHGIIFQVIEHGSLRIPHAAPAIVFQRAIPFLCISAVLYGMVQIFRPVAAVLLPDTTTRDRVNELVHRYGTNSISYFALSHEKSFFFSTSGKSVISYVLQGSTAVVAGDPIGPEDELAFTIGQFVAFCHEQDWSIVFWQIRDKTAALYCKAGFHLLKIGEDAIIDAQAFTLKGGAMANVRSSAKRAEKDGLRVLFYRGQVTDLPQLQQMDQISQHWLASKGGSEMGFSMGHFDTQGDPQQIYALAVDEQNKVHAFVSFIPIYGRKGWGLDLMRRAEQCAPGSMELLLARTIEHMKNLSYQTISLGLAPLSNANEDDETFLGTSIDFLSDRFGNPSRNQSLFNFKKKFQPVWESRYLVYSDTLNLPKIGWALYNAHQTDASLLSMFRQTLLEWQHPSSSEENNAMNVLKTVKV
jgi:phosphatidylglycerol lysyltransferase